MKPSHFRAPRELAEATFEVGRPSKHLPRLQREERILDRLIAAMFAAFLVAVIFGVM
jgi:hypothetical protein